MSRCRSRRKTRTRWYSPDVQGPTGELRVVVCRDRPRDARALHQEFERRGNLLPAQADIGKETETFPPTLVEDGEHAEPPPVDQTASWQLEP